MKTSKKWRKPLFRQAEPLVSKGFLWCANGRRRLSEGLRLGSGASPPLGGFPTPLWGNSPCAAKAHASRPGLPPLRTQAVFRQREKSPWHRGGGIGNHRPFQGLLFSSRLPEGEAAALAAKAASMGPSPGASLPAAGNGSTMNPAACRAQRRRRFSLLHAHLQPLDLPGAFIYDPGKGGHNGQQQP